MRIETRIKRLQKYVVDGGAKHVNNAADKLGVSRATIYDLINGRHEKVSPQRRNQVWSALDLPLEPEPITLIVEDGDYYLDGERVSLRRLPAEQPIGLRWEETIFGASTKRLAEAIRNRKEYVVLSK